MDEVVEVFQTHSHYVLIRKPCALLINRSNGNSSFKFAANVTELSNAVSLGVIEGVLGKFQCISNGNWHLLLIAESKFVCRLHDGLEVRRISKFSILPISLSPLPKTFQISKKTQNVKEPVSTQPPVQRQPTIVQAVQNTIKVASDMMNFKQKHKRGKPFEVRIVEELEKLFEGESDQFYYAKYGGDLTLWTQRRQCRRLRGELCDWADLGACPRTYWQPIWCRYDESFVWNHRILQDLVTSALLFLQTDEGLPKSATVSRSPSPIDEVEVTETGVEADETMLQDVEGAGQRTRLTECLCALESMLPPVISGFVKQQEIILRMFDVDGRINQDESDSITLTIISRRSQYRAGCRYRRRGIDERGYVANYVETEQVLEVPSEINMHVLSFLQIRGSVPVFWSQTGIKYKPPIQLHKNLSENQEAFRLHIERPLRKFDRLVVVNLVETAPGRQESKITKAFVRQLLLFNNSQVTYVGFDFHEYCKGLRFGNVSVLLDGVKDIIREMRYCWLHGSNFMHKQASVFRVNCVDCLDRTNLVQSVFATAVLEIQLRKLGRLPPEVDLPVELARLVQSIWADNGDALSRHYTGTAAMKGDYTRTGFRTVNGLMKDGVSSMSRYYQRFGEIKRQAAIDFLLGHAYSPELRFLRNCSTPTVPVEELSSVEASSLLAAVRSSCLESDEDSYFEFVASSTVVRPGRSSVSAFGILTSKYLHVVRLADDPLTKQQAHILIPIQSITHISLGTDSALFKQPSPVLRIHFTALPPNSNQPSMSFQNKSSEEMPGVRFDGGTPLKRFPRYHATGNQYRLDLRQTPFRLFNNYLIPISNIDEATDSLRAVAESITTFLQSIDLEVNLQSSIPPETRNTSIFMQQLRFGSSLPIEFTRPLAPAICDTLQQYRDHLRPFLVSSRSPRRLAPTSPFSSSSSSKHTPSIIPQPENSTKSSFGRMLKQSLPLVEKTFPTAPGLIKPRPDDHLSVGSKTDCLKAATAAEETDEVLLALDGTEEGDSTEEYESLDQAINVDLYSSDIDDLPTHIVKPKHFLSIADLILELEDAVEEEEEEEKDDGGDEIRSQSKNHLSHVLSFSSNMNDAVLGQNLQLTTDSAPFPSLLRALPYRSRSPFSPRIQEQDIECVKLSVKQPCPVFTSANRLELSRSLSGNNRRGLPFHHTVPLRRVISDPQITCYRELYGLVAEPRATSKCIHLSEADIKWHPQEQLGQHFQTFTIAPIDRLHESANPRLVSRLLQRQKANASAIDQERSLICSLDCVIGTHFIVF